MEKIQIVLEAVERAKGALNKTIADIEKLDQQNKKSEGAWQRLNTVVQDHDKILLGIKVAGAAVIATTALLATSAIHTADSYLQMSRAAGVTVETFSTLAFSAKQSNVEVNDLLLGLKNLQLASVSASQGSLEQVSAFRALKVEYQNADGSLRTTEQLLGDVADAFARSNDGPAKAAIAQKLFGRSSQELILFLNQGSVAIKDEQEQARRLGLEFSTKTAQAANVFGDNLNVLKGILQGTARTIIADLLPSLIRIQQFFIDQPGLVKATAAAILILTTSLIVATQAYRAFAIAGALAAATLGVGAVKNARDYLAAIQLIATTPLVAYTAGLAGAVAIITAGVKAWEAYKAAQEQAASHNRLIEFQARTNNQLKKQIDDLKTAGKLTEQQAERMKRLLGDFFLSGNDAAVAQGQKLVRDQIALAQGKTPLGSSKAAAGGKGKTDLVLPDAQLAQAKADAESKIENAALDASQSAFDNSLKLEQQKLDDALQRRTISLDDWRKSQQDIDERATAQSIKMADDRLGVIQREIAAASQSATDPKEIESLNATLTAAEINHQATIEKIQSDSLSKQLTEDKKYYDNRKALIEEALRVSNEASAAAADQFSGKLDDIAVGAERNQVLNIFDEINKAKDEYLDKLLTEKDRLAGILEEMGKINDEQPGTFNDSDFGQVTQSIEKNEKAKIDSERRIADAKKRERDKEIEGVKTMFGNIAEVSKAFGKEGFAAYKAAAIAQTIITTAQAAVGAYNSVVHIPYVGFALAPIAAAAAVAYGGVQIANIAAQKYARGGLITGDGSGTSDDVPIMASNREFMVRNKVVEEPGALQFLREFNQIGMQAVVGSTVPQFTRESRFASGGLIGAMQDTGNSGRGFAVNIGFVDGRQSDRDFQAQEGAKIVLSELRRRGNKISV